jgi:hypothetical protein
MKAANRTFLLVNFVYLVVAVFIVVHSLRFGGDGGLVPAVVGIPTLLMIAAALGLSLVQSPRRPAGPETAAESGAAAPWGRAGVIVGWLAGFSISILLAGFYPSIALYTFGFLTIQGKVSLFKAALMAAALWAVVYGSFTVLMEQRLFEGIFFGALLPAF